MGIMRRSAMLAVALAIAGCNRPEADVPVSASDMAPVDTNCAFCADPAFVRTCDVAAGVRTTLYWNVEEAGLDRVAIFVVDDAGNDSPVTEQPPRGSFETGPWLKPGLTFKLKDLHGTHLETVSITGRGC